MKDPRVYIIHIRDCITRIEQYTAEGESVFFSRSKDAGCSHQKPGSHV